MQTILDIKDKNEIKSTLSKFTLSVFSRNHNSVLHDEVYDKIIPQILGREDIDDKEKRACLLKTLRTMGLDTKIQLAESIGDEYRSMAMDFADQLIIEYDCKTASEKALAQVIANAFARTMEYSNTLETCRNKSVNTNLIGFYSMIGKELDRANKHFITNLMVLKQIKTPKIKINIKAGTAFVSENQQFNINKDK
jgi:hypothetical protein